MLANVLGLVGYVLIPTAPPRMFPELGFVDTLSTFGGLNHGSGLVEPGLEPVRCDAQPALGRRADRRGRDGLDRASLVGQGDLAVVAGLGLVRGDGDR